MVKNVKCYTSELQSKPPFDVCTLTLRVILVRRNKKNSIPELIDYTFFKKFLPFELHTRAFITLDCNDPKYQ